MQKLGLTGGIGSGKTTVAKLFEMLGAPVFYADFEAHRIRSQTAIHKQIVKHFGEKILTEKQIDKRKLANLVFTDSEALQWLNNLIHPLVEKEFEKWCGVQKEHNPKVVIMEAALIFEANFEHLFDKIIVVDAPEELRIERVMKRENISKQGVLQRIAMQMSADEKRRRADIVIQNDEQHSLIEQIEEIVADSATNKLKSP
ncbi:MAG: dephospho-CoA kinase [Bacteroidales bacterium]|nr:dephospho-CoA kinase [Bacteroidales bacterium]